MHHRALVDVELVADGLAFPEGPIACPDGSVIVCEIMAGRLTRIAADGSRSTVADVGGGPNGAAFGVDGFLYVCNNGGMLTTQRSTGGIQRVDVATGTWEWVYTQCDGQPLVAPNDIVFDAVGGMWFSDFRSGAVHYALADGSAITKAALARDPNGIGLSPDGSVLYWAHTTSRQVVRRRVTSPGTLAASNGHGAGAVIRRGGVEPLEIMVGLPGSMELDSLAIDSAGAVCVGTLVEGGVIEIPANDDVTLDDVTLDDVTHWTLPDELADALVTNICFGGSDLRTAYLTCSQHGRLVRCRWHRPGLPLVGAAR